MPTDTCAQAAPTLADIEASHAATTALIERFKAAQPRTLAVADATLQLAHGERYAGAILNDDGTVHHHVVLLPGQADSVDWPQAIAWSNAQGGLLPDRREQSLLFANLKTCFEARAYWSGETYNERAAWHQDFYYGHQISYVKGAELPARAVRRVFP